MPLSSIVSVVLRLFAIQMVGQSINMALTFAGERASRTSHPSDDWVVYLFPGALFVFALLEWWLAPVIGRLVTRKHDAEVAIGTLSRLDLYSFAFVFLGLYFVLGSIAPSLNWLHYFFKTSAAGPQWESHSSYYDLSTHLVTLIAGFFILLPARRWARRLVGRERRDETV